MFCPTGKTFLCFFITCLVLFFLPGIAHAQHTDQLNREVNIQLPPSDLIRTLNTISQKSQLRFAFDPDQLRGKQTPEIRPTLTTLKKLLDKLLVGTGLGYTLVGSDIVIAPRKRELRAIHGHILDQATGGNLMGATVQVPSIKVGITTNQYGFYSLSIPEGDYQLQVSSTGYETQLIPIQVNDDLQLEIELPALSRQLEEVVISQSALTPNPILFNEQNISPQQLQNTAFYAGETDVLKKIQMESGIKSITEGSSGLFIRGGNTDQNLILLDEAIVYNPSHLYGLVSIFNPDAINNVQVYRDYMPANFGGRLSSVIVNRMSEGNSKKYQLSGGASLMSARLAVEGPLVKNKSSFILTYRRSLLDVFHNKFKLFNPSSVYYDINAKLNYKLNQNNTLFYSLYSGKDNLLSADNYSNNWGNLTSTLRWNHIYNSRLFANTSAIFSNYRNLLDLNADTISQKSRWNTAVKDITLKTDYTYYHNPSNQIKFGLSAILHHFTPGSMYQQKGYEFNIANSRSLESTAYYTQQLSLSKSLELNYGLRLSTFINEQEQLNVFDEHGNPVKQTRKKTFINPEPRINISYLSGAFQRFFATYNLNYQYLQLIQNSTLAFSSLEPWVPASASIHPQRSNHFSLGYRYEPDLLLVSANAYYKRLDHQLDLPGHTQIIGNPHVVTQLRSGTSDAYGIETEFSKTAGKYSAILSYTYSRVYRKIADINYGNRFVANYDIPHELKLSLRYDASARLSFQSFFTYASGRPLTLPVGYYQHDGLNVPIFEGRNTSRFPDFSRLDIAAQYQFNSRLSGIRNLHSTLSIGVYNLYNRKNALYYHLNSSTSERRANTFEYAFGIYPWIAYSFKI
ncbi:outer membrane protein [Pedobacter sp. BAL39]|nr:outer membrane protein [Pedobacter sp. BAL39]